MGPTMQFEAKSTARSLDLADVVEASLHLNNSHQCMMYSARGLDVETHGGVKIVRAPGSLFPSLLPLFHIRYRVTHAPCLVDLTLISWASRLSPLFKEAA